MQGDRPIDLRRGESVGPKPSRELISYCLDRIESNGFRDGIDWETEVAENVTVEELLGALVRAEYEHTNL